MLNNLPQITDALDAGSVAVLEETRLRVRRLPIASSKTGPTCAYRHFLATCYRNLDLEHVRRDAYGA